ncbi:hypothetical protein AMATHDRAFT_66124 [Amanita thiersii Skay4041]|uniref:Uncharacterized protein n=1 Tax=Amanita thiersii Skay4041 TaxID=703135 RepID=A0A2A9NIQ2_9AGAR|nr:hypothetical protein AMATHDRAFT_66124 [Amanita thiersii Skay4041]
MGVQTRLPGIWMVFHHFQEGTQLGLNQYPNQGIKSQIVPSKEFQKCTCTVVQVLCC